MLHVLHMESDAFVQAIIINWCLPAALEAKLSATEEPSLRFTALNTYLKEI